MRHLGLDGAVRARLPAVPALRARERPDHEAFVFATRLTRLTKQLAGRNPNRAIRRATESVEDWSSGTRIGDALKSFNDRYGRRGMARGSVIVILSDGWERGDPEMVAREMERLARLAYRIVWVNPRVSAPGFQPKAGGLVAALPFCNALVSGHSLNALDQVAEAIAAEHDDDALDKSWRPPSLDGEEEEQSWGVAGSGSVGIAMPSNMIGIVPKKGRTAPGPQLVGRRRRGLRDRPMSPRSHISPGSRSKRRIAMAAPVLGATCAALMATLRNRGRRPWRRDATRPERCASRGRADCRSVARCARRTASRMRRPATDVRRARTFSDRLPPTSIDPDEVASSTAMIV